MSEKSKVTAEVTGLEDSRIAAGHKKRFRVTQEGIVFALSVAIFLAFAVSVDAFATASNLSGLVRSVSTLGILGLGMAIVVIGRGIDASMVATLVISTACSFVLASNGMAFENALLISLVIVLGIGAFIGVLIAYGEVPPIFATLAVGMVVYGAGRTWLISLDMQNAPNDQPWFLFLGQGAFIGIPMPVLIFAIASLATHVLLHSTRFGWTLYAMGDSPLAARTTGAPIRPMVVSQYMLASFIAFGAGLVMSASVSAINTRLYNSTMVYDVLLVVVLGGIGLNGGHGGVRNVVVGTLLVGILLNGMTLLNINYTLQNLIKAVMLLMAIAIDAILNPRDEQTSQQGDI